MEPETYDDGEQKKKQAPPATAPGWGNIGTGDLQGVWKKMYDNEAAKTAQQTARNLSAAERQGSEQAALAGYNPLMASRIRERAMAGAYGANQQANQALTDYGTQMSEKQLQTEEQQLESIKDIDPRAYAAAMNAFRTGGSVADALAPFLDETGNVRSYSQDDQARDALTAMMRRADEILSDPNASSYDKQQAARQKMDYALEYGTPDAVAKDPDMLKGLNQTEIATWAQAHDVPSISDKKDLKVFKDKKPGEVVILDGRLYILDSINKETVTYGGGKTYDAGYRAFLRPIEESYRAVQFKSW